MHFWSEFRLSQQMISCSFDSGSEPSRIGRTSTFFFTLLSMIVVHESAIAKVKQKVDLPIAAPTMTAHQAICRFAKINLPERFSVFAAGAYSGRPLDQQIDQSGHMATRIDLTVNHPSNPVVLMLGAYEPTVWNIGWTVDTQIIAVFASGYHRQAIAGLDTSVPTLISTHDNAGPCGSYYVDANKVGWLNPLSRRLFGRTVDSVYFAQGGAVAIGPAISVNGLVTSSYTPPESYFDKTRPMSGLAGLNEAVRSGTIRPATRQDADAWLAAVAKAEPAQNTPPKSDAKSVKRLSPDLHNAYVVLKPFTYPSGLYGANSATFFIAPGLSAPTGEKGHSTVYDFNTMRCHGPACVAQTE